MLIIEVDATDDPAHGQQQLIGYNDFYGQWMYHPLVIHEGCTGCILGTFLRPGQAHSAENILSALEPVILRLQEAYPHTPIFLRADSGFAGPKLYEFCESHEIGFTIAAPSNAVYKRRRHTPSAAVQSRSADLRKYPTLLDTHRLRVAQPATAAADDRRRL